MNSKMPAAAARIGFGLSDTEADLARHAGPAQTAVTVRVLRQVLLVIVLRVVELWRGDDLRGDPPVSGLAQRLLIVVTRAFRGGALRLVVVVDAGSILRADVPALPHALRRIVTLPERLQQLVVR